ncbi:hypothetical protein C8Q80DRAFT_1267920 [Daedaleopsis nitida]|nr:hypothetical protein C8Q80DRAFT_1267920 [Daedaleopsis nitida]
MLRIARSAHRAPIFLCFKETDDFLPRLGRRSVFTDTNEPNAGNERSPLGTKHAPDAPERAQHQHSFAPFTTHWNCAARITSPALRTHTRSGHSARSLCTWMASQVSPALPMLAPADSDKQARHQVRIAPSDSPRPTLLPPISSAHPHRLGLREHPSPCPSPFTV